MRTLLTRIRTGAVLLGAAALALTGCSAGGATPETTGAVVDDAQTTAPSEAPVTDSVSGELTVFAAASLTDVFDQLAQEFQTEHPGTTITFNYGGSSGLVTQMEEGAAVDVLATANASTMTQAVDAGLMGAEQPVFATNVLTIVTEPGNPKGITGLDDLTNGDVSLVICAEQVPCGSATQKLEEQTGVDLAPVSEENAVTDVLGKVESGQADAGIVYVTDAKGAGDKVEQVALPEAADIVNRYPIGVTAAPKNPELAQAWVEYILGEHAQQVLEDAGFGAAM